MTVYHGSTVLVETPKIMHSERKLDFGRGFYTTYNHEQAVRWSKRVADRQKAQTRIINEYRFDLTAAKEQLQVIQFDQPDVMWLDFVSMNRNGHTSPNPYDIVMGPVANDVVYTTVLLYEQGFLDKATTIQQLKVQKLYNQILFHSEASLQFCRYIRHETIGG